MLRSAGWCVMQEINKLIECYDRSTGAWQEVQLQSGADDSSRKRAFYAACKVEAL